MDKLTKITLIQRTLGLRHKLKVHESMKAPETHEDLAVMLFAKWELEDELTAIETLLEQDREKCIEEKKDFIVNNIVKARPLKMQKKTTKKSPSKS